MPSWPMEHGAGCGPVSAVEDDSAGAVTGTIEIEMGGARVRVSGVVDTVRYGRSSAISVASHDPRPSGAARAADPGNFAASGLSPGHGQPFHVGEGNVGD